MASMKRYRVSYRNSAQDDLLVIYRAIVEVSQNRQTATNYLRRLRDRCDKIGDAPFVGVARPDIGPGLRMAVFERRIVILYAVEGDTVRIVNILSGARDYATLLHPPK